MKKIQVKLPLFIVISVVFTVYLVLISGLVGYLSYSTSKDSVNTISEEFIDTTIKGIKDNLNSFLELPHKINNLNSSYVLQNNLELKEPQILEKQFISQIRSFDSLSSIYLGNTEGGLALGGRESDKDLIYTISTDNFKAGAFKKYSLDMNNKKKDLLLSLPNFDARTRPWYTMAMESKKKIWSDIYILFSGQDMAIAAAEPVYNKENLLVGVLSIDLFLSNIHTFLKDADISKNGEIFIIDKSGLLVASSTDEVPIIISDSDNTKKRLPAIESNELYIKAVTEKIISSFDSFDNINRKEYLTFSIDKEKVHTHIYPIKDNYGIDWIIAATIPEKDFMEEIWKNNRMLIIILLIASIVSAAFSLVASAWVVKPVRMLNSSAVDLAKGKWKIKQGTYFIKEIDSLNSAFNSMALQLSNALKKLKIEVGERKTAENAMEESLKDILEINKKLETYSYTISHDLKEPIRSIRTFSQFISEDYTEKLDKEGKDYLNRIIKASTKMALMIDDLLLLSKIGKQDVDFQKASFSEIIEEVTDTLAQSIKENNVNITALNMPEIYCQPVWIKTVFQNLISNSIKFSDKEETIIDISYKKLSEYHEFTIKDNGQGIEKDQHEKIFGLFRKAHQNRNIEGSGAGLAIVTSIMEQHNGRVWVDWSEKDIGTAIKFTLKNNLIEDK